MENIELEFSSLYVRIKSLEKNIQGDQELVQQLESFLQVKSNSYIMHSISTYIQKVGSKPLYIFCTADSSDLGNYSYNSVLTLYRFFFFFLMYVPDVSDFSSDTPGAKETHAGAA